MVFDRDALLAAFDGDLEIATEIIELFLDDSQDLMVTIRDSLAQVDLETLARSAHSLKGSVSNFCAEAATSAAGRLEHQARIGDIAAARGALSDVERELDLLLAALSEYLEEVLGARNPTC